MSRLSGGRGTSERLQRHEGGLKREDQGRPEQTPRASWNEAADAWNEFLESGADYYRTEVHGPALVEACGEVSGIRVLDLGSGQGYFSRQLASRGAKVAGIELADEMLRHARDHESREPLGITYHHMDAADVAREFPPASFPLVTACMSLHDMEQPQAVLGGVASVLASGGRFIFSICNPSTDTPFRAWEYDDAGEKGPLKIDRYFDEGPKLLHWNMPRLSSSWTTTQWHWTLTTWSNMLAEAGFAIQRIHEPRPTKAQVVARPDLEDCYRIPYFLVFTVVARG